MIVPALNEARNVEAILPELPPVHEVLLVDGGSVDGTVEVALRCRPDVTIIRQVRRGKGNALASGFHAATGDVIVMFDADGSADPEEIPRFVAVLVDGADFAKGSRFCARGGAQGGSHDLTDLRSLGNANLNRVANHLFGTRFTDLCYGYNAFWRDILPVLNLPPCDVPYRGMLWGDGFEIEALITCRVAAAGLRVTEVPSLERRRLFGESKLKAVPDGARVLRTLVVEYAAARRSARLRPLVEAPGPQDQPGGSAPTNGHRVHAGRRVTGGSTPLDPAQKIVLVALSDDLTARDPADVEAPEGNGSPGAPQLRAD